nr:E3 ubiquitin protein ligase DRIP2-like [Ipomoea batatas]
MASPPHDPFAVFTESGKEKESSYKGGDHSALVDLGLGLGLGFGSSSESSSSSSPCGHNQVKSGLGLGLGLGLGSENYGSFCLSDGHGVEMEAGGGSTYDDVFKYDDNKELWWGSCSHDNNIRDGHHYDPRLLLPPPHHYYCLLRPHHPPAGLWFTLRSSLNREGEVLPQIPKAYIRVKDENVTVFMVKTYLVTKLGLSNQDQVEISCMGQKLVHSQSLKHVRDAIWFPRLAELFNSKPQPPLFQHSNNGQQTPPLSYLMPLDYGPTH